MKRVTMAAPDKKLLGPQLTDYPEGFMWTWQAILREARGVYENDLDKGTPIEVNVSGYCVLHLDGRKYRFEFDPKYAARKGYDSVREGEWG